MVIKEFLEPVRHESERKRTLLVSIVTMLAAGLVFGFMQWDQRQQPSDIVQLPDCTTSDNAKLCRHEYYSAVVNNEGATQAMALLREDYDTDGSVRSDCHQLTHTIGRAAVKKYATISEAYAEGGQLCWSGYYHGVMEAIITDIGAESAAEQINTICNDISEGQRYSFYHYNCVHGLGHGTMLITGHELFQALDLCDNLGDSWEQTSCWGGVFMENIMAATNELHSTKYLRSDQPLYPCTDVAEQYKTECYKMQTSYALDVVQGGFSSVFALCGSVTQHYRATCYQSLGRDASGRSVSSISQTRDMCMLGTDFEARSNCVLGAVRDFISYHHSDVHAREFCDSLEANLQDLCQTEATSYYSIF